MQKRRSGGGADAGAGDDTREVAKKRAPSASSVRGKRGRLANGAAADDDAGASGEEGGSSTEEGGAKPKAREKPTKRLRTRRSPPIARDTAIILAPLSSSSSSPPSVVSLPSISTLTSLSAPLAVVSSLVDDGAPLAPKKPRARPPKKPQQLDAVPAELDRKTAERIVSKVTRTALAEWIVERERAQLEANGHDSVRPHHQQEWVRAQKYAVLRPLAVRMLLATPGVGINLARVGPAMRAAKKLEAERKLEAARSAAAAELVRLAKARRVATNDISRRRQRRHPRIEDGAAPDNSDDDTASDAEQEDVIRRMSKPALLEWLAYKTESDVDSRAQKRSEKKTVRTRSNSRKRTARKKTSKKSRSGNDDEEDKEDDRDEEDEKLLGDPTAMKLDVLRRHVSERKKTHGDIQVLEALWEAQSRRKTTPETLWRRKGGASGPASIALVRKTVAMATKGAMFMVRIVERWTDVRDPTFDDVSAASLSSSSASFSSSVGTCKPSRPTKPHGGAGDACATVGLEFQRLVPVRAVVCWPREFAVALESDSSGWGRTLAVPHVLRAGTEMKYKIVLAKSGDAVAESGDAVWEAHISLFATNGYASLSSRITFADVANASTLVRDAIAKRVHDAMHQVAHYSHTVAVLVAEYAIGAASEQPLSPQKSSVDGSIVSGGGAPLASDGGGSDRHEGDDSDSGGVDTRDNGENDENNPRQTKPLDGDGTELERRGGGGGGDGGE